MSRRSRSRSNNSSGESSAESSAIWNQMHSTASMLWRPGDGLEKSLYLREAVALMKANMPGSSRVVAKSVMATLQSVDSPVWPPPLPPPPPLIEYNMAKPPGAQPALLPAVLQLPPSDVPKAATRPMAQHPPKPSQAPTLPVSKFKAIAAMAQHRPSFGSAGFTVQKC